MRLDNESASEKSRSSRKNKAWGILNKVLSFTKVGTKKEEEKKKKREPTKRRSTWLPDPERRWPVQGW